MAVLEPILQPILGPILRPHYDPPQGVSLSVLVQALFAGGEKGVMFDLTRAENLYTDSARTTLVTASGDGVGSCTDLSPNAKHASSTGTKRPTWNSAGYATFDAFDDYMQTAAIDFSATDAVTVVAAVRKLSDAAAGTLIELSDNAGSSSGAFHVRAPRTATSNYSAVSRGTAGAEAILSGFAAPVTNVVTAEMDISSDSLSIRADGGTAATSASDQGTGNYGNYALNIGARNTASLFLSGRIYRLLVIGRTLTTTERNAAERWAAQPVGITIP